MIGPWASKDAEVFADALEGRGPRNSEVRDLVRFAESLCESAVDPSPEFLLSLRAQLMADASTVLVQTPKTVHSNVVVASPVAHPVRRRLAAATATLIAMSGSIGIVASSAEALPGDMLYSVKRGVETVELSMHRSDASRGSFQLAQATERLAEARSLSTQTDSRSEELVVKSLAEFTTTAAAGSKSLFKDFNNGGDKASIDEVSTFAKSSNSVLASMSTTLPASSADAFKDAATTVTDLVSEASSLCSACNITSLPSNLASVVKNVTNPLTTSKPASKPATTTTTSGSTPGDVVSGLINTVTNPQPSAGPTTSPPATSAPVNLGTVTKPVVGALLGDDTQTGLVPGLLGALLGTGKK